MDVFKILFALGKDRPGIVDQISELLLKQGANIEDSRMAALGGYFSVMALFSCKEDRLKGVQAGLRKLEKIGFITSLHEARDPRGVSKEAPNHLGVKVEAMDHPGIVHEVVHILHGLNVNIHSLDTHVTNAPVSGGPLFHLVLEAEIPPETDSETVKAGILQRASESGLDLEFT